MLKWYRRKTERRLTNMTRKTIIKRAEQIDDMLQKVKDKAQKLLETMDEDGTNYYPHFKELINTLESLVGFDLEDSIIIAKDYEEDK